MPRKMYKADIIVKTDDYRSHGPNTNKDNHSYSLIRNSFNNLSVTNGSSTGVEVKSHRFAQLSSGGRRKDEKSETSVRDKIALFSNGDSMNSNNHNNNKFQGHLARSTECLDTMQSPNEQLSRNHSHSSPNKSSHVRCHSVEALDEVDRGGMLSPKIEVIAPYESAYHSKFMVEKSKPVPMLEKAFSVESISHSDIIPPPVSYGTLPRKASPPINQPLLRRTSFSGDANANANDNNQRKSTINTLLEQRKRSMSKLRGLVIPEKVPESDIVAPASVIGMPVIKSKDCEMISNEILPQISQVKLPSTFVRRASVDAVPIVPSQQAKPYVPSYRTILNAVHADRNKINAVAVTTSQPLLPTQPPPPIIVMPQQHQQSQSSQPPPAKPPRTSLHKQSSFETQSRSPNTDDSEDSDSISLGSNSNFKRRLTPPPISPSTLTSDKQRLTRTTSSETNVSVTSSNSTLTTGSISSAGSQGSQASCSSVSSTSTIDMSRRIQKPNANGTNMNRKNILALSKLRNGKEEKLSDGVDRYNDGSDSTEEEDVRKPKISVRSTTTTTTTTTSVVEKESTSYRLVGPTDVLDIKTVNIAQCVEVVDYSPSPPSITTSPDIKESFSSRVEETETSPSMSDLAKWVRNEAAKTVSSGFDMKTIENNNKNDNKYEYIQKFTKVPLDKVESSPKRDARFAEPKKLNLTEIRKTFEAKATTDISPQSNKSSVVTQPHKERVSTHDRFSSWDSVASSSSGVSSMQTSSLIGNTTMSSNQNLQSPPSDFGSFSSLGSSHSLITPQVCI